MMIMRNDTVCWEMAGKLCKNSLSKKGKIEIDALGLTYCMNGLN